MLVDFPVGTMLNLLLEVFVIVNGTNFTTASHICALIYRGNCSVTASSINNFDMPRNAAASL